MALEIIIFNELLWSGFLLSAKFSADFSGMKDSVHGMRIHAAMLQQLKEQCDQKNEELEDKKRKGKEIQAALESSSFQFSEERLSQLDMHQLQQLKQKLEKLRDDLLCCQASAPLLNPVEPLNLLNANKPPIPENADLENDGRDGRADSPIPPDWLKL